MSIAAISSSNPNGVQQLLPCQVGAGDFCLDMSLVKAIERSDLLQHNPAKHPVGWLLGETEIPVYSLAVQLGQPLIQREGRILVLEDRAKTDPSAAIHAWGLLVDRVSRSVVVEPQQIMPLPRLLGARARQRILGVWGFEERLHLYFQPEGLLGDTAVNKVLPEPPASLSREPRLSLLAIHKPSPRTVTRAGRMLFFTTSQSGASDRPAVFGLSLSQVVEILDLPDILPVPGAPSHIRGLVQWRGRALAVLDMDRWLEWSSSAESANNRLIIVRIKHELVGLVATSNLRMVRLPIRHQVADTRFANDRVRAVFELEQETLVIPNLESLIPQEVEQVIPR